MIGAALLLVEPDVVGPATSTGTPPWMVLLGLVITGVLTLGASKLTGRSTERVAQVTVEGEAYVRARDHLTKTIDELAGQVEALRSDQAEDRERIEQLEAQLAGVQRDNTRLRQMLEDLDRKYRAALRYIACLRVLLSRAGGTVPAPPADMLVDLDGGT